MDEKDKTAVTASDVLPGVKFQDPRPTDLQVFFSLLPTVLGGLASRSDTRSANPTAFILIRECLGQCAAMGTLRATFVCNDGSTLALMPQNQVGVGVQAPIQHQPGSQGVMVQQYPNQPGQGQPSQQAYAGGGGAVQQYPNQAPPPQHGMPFGDGSKGVMVAMFPNQQPPPQQPPQL
jgi:hypothetical protein